MKYLIPRSAARDLDGPDCGAWVRRGQRTTPATQAAHPGQRWPTRDLSVLLAGCGCKAVQYHGSRQGIPLGLEVPGELPMPLACGAITRARSDMRARALPCCRRTDRLTFLMCKSWLPQCAAVIPHSLHSRAHRRLMSRYMPQAKLTGGQSCCTTRAAARDAFRRRSARWSGGILPSTRRRAIEYCGLAGRAQVRLCVPGGHAHVLGSVGICRGAAAAASARALEAAWTPRCRATQAPRVIPRSRGQCAGAAAESMWGLCESPLGAAPTGACVGSTRSAWLRRRALTHGSGPASVLRY